LSISLLICDRLNNTAKEIEVARTFWVSGLTEKVQRPIMLGLRELTCNTNAVLLMRSLGLNINKSII